MEIITEKSNDNLRPLAINEILNKKFFVPHYQRGYRWTAQQIIQLLDDIDAFSPREIPGKLNERTFYCLQPVVTKELSKEIREKYKLEGNWLELIDGQQRITTIYLIIQYINEFWTGKKKQGQFEIKFETRIGRADFLKNIEVIDESDLVDVNKENIDFFHISSAYQTIRNWELNYEKNMEKLLMKQHFNPNF